MQEHIWRATVWIFKMRQKLNSEVKASVPCTLCSSFSLLGSASSRTRTDVTSACGSQVPSSHTLECQRAGWQGGERNKERRPSWKLTSFQGTSDSASPSSRRRRYPVNEANKTVIHEHQQHVEHPQNTTHGHHQELRFHSSEPSGKLGLTS